MLNTPDHLFDDSHKTYSPVILIHQACKGSIEQPKLPDAERDIIEELYPRGINNIIFFQKNIGDCYFLSADYALRENPIAEEVIRATISKGNNDYIVKFLGAPSEEEPLVITQEDLNGQEVINSDGEVEYKMPVDGDLGDKILERAHHRRLKGKRREIYTMRAGEGGFSSEVLQLLLGPKIKQNIFIGYAENCESFSKSSNEIILKLQKLLKAKANNRFFYLINASTHKTGHYQNEHGAHFMDERHQFRCNHSYALTEVISRGNDLIIHLVDPHNSAKVHKLSFEQFCNNFNIVNAAELKELFGKMLPPENFEMTETLEEDEENLTINLFDNSSVEVEHIGKKITLTTEGNTCLIGSIERKDWEYFFVYENFSYLIEDKTLYPIGRFAIWPGREQNMCREFFRQSGKISRKHCKIYRDGNKFTIINLQPSNGLKISGIVRKRS